MEVRVGTVTKPTGAAPVSVDVNLGTTPKVIFFTHSRNTAAGVTTGASLGFGVAVHRSSGVEEACIALAATDGTDSAARYNNNGKCVADIGVGSTNSLADCTFLFANHAGETINGFRLTFTTNDAVATVISYLAICGDDVTDAQITTIDVTTGGPNVYSVGFDFWPDVVVFFGDGQNTLNNRADDGTAFNIAFWAQDTNSTQNSISLGIDVASGSDYIGLVQSTTGTTTGTADADITAAVSMAAATALDTAAPGVTVTEFIGSAHNHKVYALGIQGGKWGTKRNLGPGSAGSQSITGIGFLGRGLLGAGGTPSTSATSGDKTYWVGMSNVTTNRADGIAIETRTSPGDDTAKAHSTTGFGVFVSSALPSIVGTVSLTSFDTDGLTLNWSVASNGRQQHYLVMGDGPVWFADGLGEAA